MRELVRTNAGLRILVAPCTPRSVPDFATHAEFALVREELLSIISLHICLVLYLTSVYFPAMPV